MSTAPTLRLTQTIEHEGTFHIAMELTGVGPRIAPSSRFRFELSEGERQDIRWYIEEYAEHPFAPHPERAARIEQQMRAIGIRLFRCLFAHESQQRLWAKVCETLSALRIEIISTPHEAAVLPWELLRDPITDTPVALSAGAFVRAHPEAVRQARSVQAHAPIRILLVICRPGGSDDVPFRSVASRLIKGLSDENRAVFQLDVLRPPTFARLSDVLRNAQRRGEPYHVVHFDGHGVYGDPALLRQRLSLSPLAFTAGGPQGFLLFEHDDPAQRLVHGLDLGNLLHETQVPLLVLNACRSAHTEPAAPEDAEEAQPADSENPYDKVRAFGSLAQQVMLQGVTGVVAMRYNVYVVTAAQFVADLYAALARGCTLGEAVTFSRKQLATNPLRQIRGPIALQDWMVPVVYEAEAVQLFAPHPADTGLTITINPMGTTRWRSDRDPSLPHEPDVGFFGRDETLLALDRGFDQQHVVLLHAYAGSGKTSVAAEFAHWYRLTGGVGDGPVLFSSFTHHRTLTQLLDQLGQRFDADLQQQGIHWAAITDLAQKRDLALHILRQVPVLWVWDNVEPVAGFPAGTPSVWTTDEQRELADFLRDTRGTKAKFLLTSRRDEHAWLGDLPMRVTLPPMPLHERWQLAEALAARYGAVLPQSEWRPLLVYSQGNPMTLTIVMRQALRDGLHTAPQIRAYVERLRAGEAVFDDDENEGRSKSLGASLSYGFDTAFSEQERAILALLYHFQGFVDVRALQLMGATSEEWHTSAVAGLTHKTGIVLLNRAVEVGLLMAHDSGSYTIHPALPWFLRRLYEEHYVTSPFASLSTTERGSRASDKGEVSDSNPTRAYVEAMGELSNYYAAQYEGGKRGIITLLQAEEANLLHAQRLALRHGWYHRITSVMQGLRGLYAHTGRRAEWRTLVRDIVSTFTNPVSDGPLAGREAQWSTVIGYRVRLLREDRQLSTAARLQALQVDYQRQRAAPLLLLLSRQLNTSQRNTLRSLGVSLHELGEIQREQGDPICVAAYEEDYHLSLMLGDKLGAAIDAFNLGRVYTVSVPALRDLAQGEVWCRRGLELTPESDSLVRGKGLGQIGLVAYERFKEARQAEKPEAVLLEHLNAARQFYQQQLDLTPPDAIDSLADAHNALGNIDNDAGQTDHAFAHYCESIRYWEQADDLYRAANTRENVAITYANTGRLDLALLFAQAALRNFEQLDPTAADRVGRVRGIIAMIEGQMQGGSAHEQ